jgi:hypothetical protein
MTRAIIKHRVFFGSIEALKANEIVEVIQYTQKNYLIRKIALDGIPFFEVFSIRKENLTMIEKT